MFSDCSPESPHPLNGRAGPVRRKAEVILLLPRQALIGEVWGKRSTDPPWGCSLRGDRNVPLAKSAKDAKRCMIWQVPNHKHALRAPREVPRSALSMNVHATRVHEEYRGRRACSDQPSPPRGLGGGEMSGRTSVREPKEMQGCASTRRQETRYKEAQRTTEQGLWAQERL